jgi:hypothetical protein
MSHVPTHDYLCPCDLCEPEAHSVTDYPVVLDPHKARTTPPPRLDLDTERPIHLHSGRLIGREPNVQDLNRGLEMTLEGRTATRKASAPTMKPGAADVEVAAFESLVKQVGEGKARWSKLLELLEDQSK